MSTAELCLKPTTIYKSMRRSVNHLPIPVEIKRTQNPHEKKLNQVWMNGMPSCPSKMKWQRITLISNGKRKRSTKKRDIPHQQLG
jgi:GTP cyclohydrolase FolE2